MQLPPTLHNLELENPRLKSDESGTKWEERGGPFTLVLKLSLVVTRAQCKRCQSMQYRVSNSEWSIFGLHICGLKRSRSGPMGLERPTTTSYPLMRQVTKWSMCGLWLVVLWSMVAFDKVECFFHFSFVLLGHVW